MSLAAITIDTEFPDQPAADPLGVTDRLLEILAAREVRATFFVVGAWARAHPERVRAIVDAGHHVGSHSYAHCSLNRMTDEGIVEDLLACHEVLEELGVESRPWFRAPYGETGGEGRDVTPAIARAGYRHVHWHARGEDWRPGITAGEIADMVVGEVGDRWPRPAIVLLHSWPDAVPAALEAIVDRLRAQDATFVTVDQIRTRHAVAGRVREAAQWRP